MLAKAGVDVILLERGPYPGSKNMSGGAVYSLPTQEIIPGYWQEAPIERILVDQQYWLMTDNSAVKLGFTSIEMGEPPYNKVSVLRATFDPWYASKATGAGARLWTGCKVERLIVEDKKVVGVKVNGTRCGNLMAKVVILAQGVNPILAEEADLIGKPQAGDFSLYIKELFHLPEEVINERFHLKKNQGAVIGLVGANNAGLIGTGSIYTFKEHVGLNTGISVKTLTDKKVNITELMARLKKHPIIEPLIQGGTTVEYLAHMIPEGGFNAIPTIVFDGMMIAGDAAGLVNGTHGINLAMYSGKFAADTAIEALELDDSSRRVLNRYWDKLEGSFILKDLRDNRRIPGWYAGNPTLFDDYIGLFNQVAMELSMVYPVSRRRKRRLITRKVLSMRPVGKILVDAFNAARVMK